MKILIIHNSYRIASGEERYVELQEKLLKKNGHEVEVFTINNSEISEDLIEGIRIAKGFIFKGYKNDELEKKLSDFQPEIAHVHNIWPQLAPSVYKLLKENNISIVQTIHNYRFMCPKGNLFRNGKLCTLCVGKNNKWLSIKYGCYAGSRTASLFFNVSMKAHNNSFQKIDSVIFPSKFTYNFYNKQKIFKDVNTYVIPNFTTSSMFSKVKKNNNFVFLGRISDEKGIGDLVKIFKNLSTKKLNVIGEGPLLKDLKKKYEKEKNIVFEGKLVGRKLKNNLEKSEVMIVPSKYYEVMPMVVVEAFERGLPVIVPKIGSFVEMVEDGVNGWFYEEGDLKKTIIRVGEKHALDKHCIAARREYEEKYSDKVHYEKLINVYKNLV